MYMYMYVLGQGTEANTGTQLNSEKVWNALWIWLTSLSKELIITKEPIY